MMTEIQCYFNLKYVKEKSEKMERLLEDDTMILRSGKKILENEKTLAWERTRETKKREKLEAKMEAKPSCFCSYFFCLQKISGV